MVMYRYLEELLTLGGPYLSRAERLVGPSKFCHIVTIFSTQSPNSTAPTLREKEYTSLIQMRLKPMVVMLVSYLSVDSSIVAASFIKLRLFNILLLMAMTQADISSLSSIFALGARNRASRRCNYHLLL